MFIKKFLPIIGIIILIYIFITIDIVKIIDVFLQINIWFALLSLFAIYPILLLVNYEWQLILKKHKIRVSYIYSLKNILIGYFYGFITPGGLGGYTRAIYLKDESGEPIQKCFVNLLILSTIDYLTLLSLGSLGGFLISSIFPNIFPIFLFIFILVVSLLIFFIRKNTGKLFFTKILQSKLLTSYKEKWHSHVDSLYKDIPVIKDLVNPIIVSFFGWVLWFSELYFISKLFSINIPYFYFILIIAVANVIALLPITIQGLGTREVALIGLFSIFNVPQENALSFSLFWFVLSWLIPSVIGSIITVNETRKNPTQDKKKKFLIDNTLALQFTKYMEKYLELYHSLARKTIEYISKSVIKPVIVDVGAGSGLLTIEIKKILPHAQVISMDPSINMLSIANEKFQKNNCKYCYPLMARTENIPLKNHFADIIVSRFSLSSWIKPKQGFSEIFRILKPNGIIFIEALNKNYPKWKLQLIKFHMIFKRAGKNVIKYHIDYYKNAFSLKEVEQILTESGFDIIKKNGKKFDWKFTIIAKRTKSYK